MANSTTFAIDPAALRNTAIAGTAQLPADSTAAFWTKLFDLANCVGGKEIIDTTATALNPLIFLTQLQVTGTMAFTLADGTYSGQRKRIECTVAATTPAGTLTIATPSVATGLVTSSTIVFDSVGQSIDLLWTGSFWRCIKSNRAGVKTTVVGTTVLTGNVLCHTLACSVTATVSSTGTKAIPDGQYPGDMLIVSNTVAASTPIGNINFTGVTLANVAATDLQAIGATTDTVTLTWNGTAWLVIANSGITVA